MSNDLFSSIRGGIEYKNIHCNLWNYRLRLEIDNPDIASVKWTDLIAKYKELHPEYVKLDQELAIIGPYLND